MKNNLLAVVTTAVALSLSGLCQETTSHRETTTNHNVTAAAIMDMGHFTIHPPTGNGWQIAAFDPTQHPDAKTAFHNDSMKASVTVQDRELNPPVRDVQAELLRTKERMKQKFESESKVVLFEGNSETHSGGDCLYTRIIFDPSDKLRSSFQPSDVPNSLALHTLACIYGEKHDRIATLIYLYPTEGTNDPQARHARDFFESVKFKDSPPK